MAIVELRVAGYRSVEEIILPLQRINVLVGPNGCGKSNLYHSMYLLAQAANGRLAQTLAAEGGMPLALWAGPRRHKTRQAKPVRVKLGVVGQQYGYELYLGLPPGVPPSQFDLDPEVKEEFVWLGDKRHKRNTLLERKAQSTWVRDGRGQVLSYPMSLSQSESVLSQLHEPHLYPELACLREMMQRWRFYHHFRTDADSPLRFPQVGVRTPILSNDGGDLAAALQTIIEVGAADTLAEVVDQAFRGARLQIQAERGRFEVLLHMPGIQRPFEARELSDGTLRFLALVAALLSPRPADMLALNEPEMSLHPDLLKPLARLIVAAGNTSQLWITTHSQQLANYIYGESEIEPIELQMNEGRTCVVGTQDWTSQWLSP